MKTILVHHRLASGSFAVICILAMLGCPEKTVFKPFDLVVNPAHSPNVDFNGYLINPLWGHQKMNGIHALPDRHACSPTGSSQDDVANWLPCSDYILSTNRTVVCGPHVNFSPVQYRGTIFWTSKSDAWADDDYNVTFVDAGKSLNSKQSQDGILGEFNSDETIDHFGTAWWDEFHHAVDDDERRTREMIDGKPAIAIGLLGLDCAKGHDCKVELHPVYILAIRVSGEGPHEHWVFFARNEGDEGACSGEDQYLPETANGFQYSIVLPNPTATDFAIARADVRLYKDGSSGPVGHAFATEFLPGQGLKLTFILADPDQVDDDNEMVIEGDMEIRWL